MAAHAGITYEIAQGIDTHTRWRWSAVVGGRRISGQTKISRRAAEIQAKAAIDRRLMRLAKDE